MIKAITVCIFFAVTGIGCATSNSKISKDGKIEEVVFPAIETAWRKEGTIPNRYNVAKVSPGISKDQIYSLLGPPHFNEGFVAVREWNYIFTFKDAVQNLDEVCQFKIIYNQSMRLQEVYWKPENCSKYSTETNNAG